MGTKQQSRLKYSQSLMSIPFVAATDDGIHPPYCAVTRSLAQVPSLDVELGVCEGPSSAVVLPVDDESPAVVWSLGSLPVIGHLQLQRPQLSLSSAVKLRCGGSDSDPEFQVVGNGGGGGGGGGGRGGRGGRGGGGGECGLHTGEQVANLGDPLGLAGAGPSAMYIS